MSLAVGIIAKEGFVIAADSRMSSPHFLNDTAEKIIILSDDVAVGIAGDGALAFHIFDLLKKDENFKLILAKGIHDVADHINLVFSKTFDKYYPGIPHKDREELELLLGGYSSDDPKIPHLYVLSSEDNFVPRQSPAGHNSIGVSHISKYILNRIYEKGKMASEQAIKLSVFCIRETGNQTKSVGGLTRVGAFIKDGKFSLLPNPSVAKIVNQCKNMQDSHKNKFYPEEIGESDLSENK